MSDFSIEFLTKAECGLCESAHPLVTRASRRLGVDLTIVDVTTDPDLQTAYGERVPVVLGPTGDVIAEGVIDDYRALRRAIRQAL